MLQREARQGKDTSPVDEACKLKPQLLIGCIFFLTYGTKLISSEF